ncbi:tetratricopeptide repeat protein [Ideonella sp. DXS29W]|uniref:Tetratricopeptide repeat protein n=1 Tax=Ideonella lacteola TaxID=2984193 RepID=A0ABU9BKH8_9BURK
MTLPTASPRLVDPRDNRLGTSSHEAADRVETALWRMMSFFDTPVADLEAAHVADPGWALPLVMHAGFLLSLTEPGQHHVAAHLLDTAEPLLEGALPREQAHFEAQRAVAEGRWQHACRIWDDLLLEHPRDALALQWSQLWDFYRGDVQSLRLRPARALPEWSESDPLFPYVLGLYAFGLEECNLYPQAEDVGRHAVAGDARVPWAVHAVAHVMEMQGRFEDGTAWLRQHQPGWSEGNGFAGHLWWHMGLFRLEALDVPGVQRLIDAHLSGPALQITLQRLDAAALLWRMHLLDIDVGARFVELLRDWQPSDSDAGHHAFNDLHVLVALLGADELVRAESWIARCAARAMAPEDARRSNHTVAREVGLPLMRGLLAFAHGDADQAVAHLQPARLHALRIGGSHAQRDLIDQTLLAASARASHRHVGRALLNERRMAKPITPLTRHWAEQLGLSA